MRIDAYLFQTGIAKSRTAAQAMIAEGRVLFDSKPIKKPSFLLPDEALDPSRITLKDGGCPYVSRGGFKLEAALHAFGIDPSDAIALDIGASTGGFTDCLLQHGARKVYAVDSGREQLDARIKDDSRVVSLESYNARYMKPSDFEDVPTLAVMDVSFISQTLLYPAIASVLPIGADLISLVKPQFEVGRQGVGGGGIVRNEKLRTEALDRVKAVAAQYGLTPLASIDSPITGGDGNHEFLVHFRRTE